jgi:hypothetical protein
MGERSIMCARGWLQVSLQEESGIVGYKTEHWAGSVKYMNLYWLRRIWNPSSNV